MTDDTPHLCECGCGQATSLARFSDRTRGYVKDQPLRFVKGHSGPRPYPRRTAITPADYAVEDRGYDTPCWVWRNYCDRQGYGRLTMGGASILAHRAMYEQAVGPIPSGLELDHLCRVPPCIRPEHLEAVTRAENLRRGKSARLTAEDAAAIRVDARTHAAIATAYGISERHVWDIRNGKFWK